MIGREKGFLGADVGKLSFQLDMRHLILVDEGHADIRKTAFELIGQLSEVYGTL